MKRWLGRSKSDAAVSRRPSKAERLARCVLMFFEPGDWSAEKRAMWFALSGKDEATSRVLADLAREVRDEEERK